MTTQPSFWQRLFGRGTPEPDRRARRGRSDQAAAAGTPREVAGAKGSSDTGGGAGSRDAPAGSLKALRASRREQLFAIVRENMVRSGVLATAYKFKILTLDRQAQDFIVLCDIHPSAFDGHPNVLAKLESSLKLLARERMDVNVRSVYWRHAQVIASGRDAAPSTSSTSSPSATAAAAPVVIPAQVVAPPITEDAVTEEEVLALKQALAAAHQTGATITRTPTASSKNLTTTRAAPAARASVSASSVPEWKRRDFAPTQPMMDDEEDSLYMPLSETQLGRLD